MSENKAKIETTKIVYPQIYAYTHPDVVKCPDDKDFIKIGYTQRKDYEQRIKEQNKTAGVRVDYEVQWHHSAKYPEEDEWFKDHELHSYLTKYKQRERRPKTEWFNYHGMWDVSEDDFYDFLSKDYSYTSGEISYSLRQEQEKAVEMALDYFNTHQNGEFLWNAKPRFGKTLSSYDLAVKMDAKKVLIVTNRPSIAASWFDDFEKFIAWQFDYSFISTASSLEDKPINEFEEWTKTHNVESDSLIAFLSLQDLKGSLYFGGEYDKLEWVRQVDWDLFVVDECHEGIDTLKTDGAFQHINRRNTLYLSGTPFKAIAKGKFDDDQMYHWTYVDEQQLKDSWDLRNEGNNPYETLPVINMFSYQMSDMILEEVNKGACIDEESVDYAFNLSEFFGTEPNGKFSHEAEVRKWLDKLTNENCTKYPFSTKELRDQLNHTLWVMGSVASAKAMEKMLNKHPVFENYKVVQVAGDGRPIGDETEDADDRDFLAKVKKAIKENKKTITITVGRLTTGITVPEWSAVLMLSNIASAPQYMQAAFRAQNPYEFTDEAGNRCNKKNAYVFDFAPERTLEIYDEFANGLNPNTAGGRGETQEHKANIRECLNFFPVIAEDEYGSMTEINVEEVMSIPKAIKAREVVRRGFMCNLLFKNVWGVFRNEELKKILNKLPEAEQGKIRGAQKVEDITGDGVQVDEQGDATVNETLIISETEASLGPAFYSSIKDGARSILDNPRTPSVVNYFVGKAKEELLPVAQELDVKTKKLEKTLKENFEPIGREIACAQKTAETEKNIVEVKYQKLMTEPEADITLLRREKKQKLEEIENICNNKINRIIDEKTDDAVNKTAVDLHKIKETTQKNKVECDTRARLRGFARTIPSFLMAYGNENTCLDNFDKIVDADVFEEVTGITVDDFKVLRDEGHFFDEIVFDESCKEFLNRKQKLANYFTQDATEDIFDYIPPQKTNQIFTPRKVVTKMLDLLEAENPGIFSDPNKTFADLYVKSGLYLTEIAKRLFKGLEDEIPDEEARIKHIFENQLFGFAPTPIIHAIAKNFMFGFDGAQNLDTSHLFQLDLTPYAKGETQDSFAEKLSTLTGGKIMKFDCIVGNPPYQEEATGDDTSGYPIYQYFYECAYECSDQTCLISPARFLFNAGKTPADWNQKQLEDSHFKVLNYEPNASNYFVNTDIKGGVAITYHDKKQEFEPIGVFTAFEELTSIYKKCKSSFKDSNLTSIICRQNKFNLESLYEDYPELKQKIGSGGKDKRLRSNIFEKVDLFVDQRMNEDDYEIKGMINGKRVVKFIAKPYISDNGNLFSYKVLVPSANGSGALGEVLSTPLIGEPLIGEPLIGHTQSYISFGDFETRAEAENCMKYIKSKFARTLLGVVKVTQDNPPEKWRLVPLQDFTQNSDIDWSKSVAEIDQQLYAKYGLDEHEVEFIESKVKAME